MRDSCFSLKLSNPDNHVVTSLTPISKGPYSGHDWLMLMDNLCGKAYVIRSTVDGKHLSVSEKVNMADGPALVQKMINEQNQMDCDAVTGGGRWSCE